MGTGAINNRLVLYPFSQAGQLPGLPPPTLARTFMPIEALASYDEVLSLLSECGLPVCDISTEYPPQFFGVRSEGKLAGVIGLEFYTPFALLRSLAVAPAFRSAGLGRRLVAHAEAQGAAHGIQTLFLLTSTAEQFFLDLGYAPTSRTTAPPAIQGTSQFSGLCPSSATFLCKSLP